MNNQITKDRLMEVMYFDESIGALRWKNGDRNKTKDAIAGCLQKGGYRRIKVDGAHYLAHRLIWVYFNGFMPDKFIDHIDGNPLNNRINNLRIVDMTGNKQNTRVSPSHNTSGYLGVSWRKESNKWLAQISVNTKKKHIGLFDTAEDAHQAYLKTKRLLHATCTI